MLLITSGVSTLLMTLGHAHLQGHSQWQRGLSHFKIRETRAVGHGSTIIKNPIAPSPNGETAVFGYEP